MRKFAPEMNLNMLLVIGFECPIMRLVKMDQNRHDLACSQLPRTFSLLACFQLARPPLRSKAHHKIIDSTKQFQYTHSMTPPMMDRNSLSGSYSRSSQRGLLIQNSR